MIEYLDLVEDVLTNGKYRESQKPEKSIDAFFRTVRYNLEDGFPLITTRDMSQAWPTLVAEKLWIMSGSTNAYDLLNNYGSKLWLKWAKAAEEKLGYKNGELGPTYGYQLRNFAGKTDQLVRVLDMLKKDPRTRKAIISYWNLGDVVNPDCTNVVDVAPCILDLHFVVLDGKLNLGYDQRSADIGVGVPFDTAQHALWLMMFAKELSLPPGELAINFHLPHVYEFQIPAMKELLKRKPYPRPRVTISDSPSGTIFDHRVEDFQLHDYQAHPAMKIPVAL